MIHIEQGQSIPENENIFVASPIGDYEDNALIEFYNSEDPEKIVGAFAAQYVKYGGLVYRFSDPKELGAEILKIDPESTHMAASFVRMQNELLKQFNQGDLEASSLDTALLNEQVKMEEQMDNPSIDQNATTTQETATTTAPVANNNPEFSAPTSTPVMEQPVIPQVAGTSTQPVIESSTSSANSTSPVDATTSNATSTNGFVDNLINNVVEAVTSTPTTSVVTDSAQGLVVPATSTVNTAQNILEEIIEAAISTNSTTTGI